MKRVKDPGINKFFILASMSLTATAIITLPLAGSNANALAYLTGPLTLIFAILGASKKDAKIPTPKASTLIMGSSAIYGVLGLLMLWVIMAELSLAPQVPMLSNFQYPNYLVGWPVVELVILGSIANALFRLTRPAWIDYLGGALAVMSIIIWRVAVSYGVIPGV